ncbi:MAG: hypothetical protein IID36_02655 [Planctomycetes bacterium]|nr:hypothetical protein [Planctomycetota bacterium]
MLAKSVEVVLAISCFPLLSYAQVGDDSWRLDKHEVLVGGCVTVVVDLSAREAKHVTIQVDDRNPVRLGQVGPVEHRPGETAVLLWLDLTNPEGMEVIDEERRIGRLVPIFARPGRVRVTLAVDGQDLGTRVVTVVPCVNEESQQVIDLLYPLVGDGRKEPPKGSLWIRLVMERTFGLTPRLTEEQRRQLHDELPIMKRHTDWGEVCEMRLARMEAVLHFGRIVKELEEAIAKDGSHDLPGDQPIPELVTRAVENKLTSAFAKAIQDDIRERLKAHKRFVRHLRGEQLIWETIKSDKDQPPDE